MSQFIDSIKEVKRNWKTYDAWEQNQADDAAQRKYLSDKLELPTDKVALTREKTKIVLRASDMLDKRSENNCEDTERATGYIGMAAVMPMAVLLSILSFKHKMKNPQKIFNKYDVMSVVAPVLTAIGIGLWGNEKQKEASRIGRFQAKKHELNDVKNFVIYTPEQIEAAKIVAKSIPDKKNNKSISKLFAEMKQMSKDKAVYKEWLKDKVNGDAELQKVLNTSFTTEQIEQGKEDKEIVTNIVKDINIKAEEYSENMENAYDTMGLLSFFADIPLAFGINKLINKVSKNPNKFAKTIGVISPFLVSGALLFKGTNSQKKAAQVGRYKKRQEILNNPEVLMNYTDEQVKQAQHIKAPKKKEGFFEGIVNDFKFFINYRKDLKEYDNHVKTEGKQNEKLIEALKQSNISDKQLKDAKFLQEKTFMTFDKIDEMSQRYSEDTEAGTEVAKQGFGLLWSAVLIGGGLLFKQALSKGKIPFHKIAKSLSDFALEKNAPIRKTVDKACDVISKNKALKEDIGKSFISPTAQKRVVENPEIQKLLTELPQISDIQSQLKKGRIMKWLRNLTGDIAKFIERIKVKKEVEGLKEALKEGKFSSLKELEELKEKEAAYKTNFGGIKHYKTLAWSAGAGLSTLLLVLGLPGYALSAWLTNIQKKAGKIGIMKAMNDLDNPQLFVNKENSEYL